MCKKSLLFLLLMAVFAPWAAQAQTTVEIGDGTSTSYYTPIGTLYNYSITEQLYTADEIGMAGTISSIRFNYASSTAKDYPIEVYMQNVDAEDLATGISLADAELVFEGTLSVTETGWVTIELDTPFNYDGTSNLLIGVNKGYVYWFSGNTWYYTSATNMARYSWNDNNAYDLSTTPETITANRPNIQIDITAGTPPTCPKPTQFTVSNVTAHTADLAWESDASAWQIMINDDEDNLIDVTTNSYSLTALTPQTSYNVKVRANCDGDYSLWASKNFTTTIACPAPTGLTSSNISGHNATITWTAEEGAWYQCALVKNTEYDASNINWSESFEGNTQSWVNLDPETGYTFTLRKDCGSEDGYSSIVGINFTTTVACPAPTGLTATLTPGNGSVATISWTSSASAWVVAYEPFGGVAENFTEIEVTENSYTFTDLTPETTYSVKVKAVCGGDDGESQWSNLINFTPTDAYTLTVNDGTTTNGYVPIYGFYVDNKSYSQFIIPAADLAAMQWGTINEMTFYGTVSGSNPTWPGTEFEVYMTEVNNTTLNALADWGDMEKVMDAAHLQIDNEQMVVVLDVPYQYEGGNLMIGIKQTVSGSYSSCSWQGVSATGASMGGYGSYVSQQNFLPKTTFTFEPGEEPSCIKPNGLTVNYTGGTTAEVSWNSDATAWNLEILNVAGTGPTIIENVSNPYTLTDLELGTTYQVAVQTVCATSNSEWTSSVSFTTDLCMPENQCELTFVVTDSYGDSWNGNAIQVKDVLTGSIIATIANENLDGTTGTETQTVTLNVCDGRQLEFSWISGSYISEVSYTVTDVNNEVIVEGSGAGFDTFTATVSCTVTNCDRPTDVTINYTGGTEAIVSWTSEAESWNLYVNGEMIENVTNPYTMTGLELATTYSVEVQAICSDGPSNLTTAVSFTTDLCMPENQCTLTFVVTDSYGDGWNGASIDVYDYTDQTIGDLLASITNENLDGENVEETQTVTLNICDGQEIAFIWTSGNYDDEVSYIITDLNDDVIIEGEGAGFDAFAYTMNCTVTDCRKPSDFTVSQIGPHSVVLSWTENGPATEWDIAYLSENDTVVSHITTTDNPFTLTGLDPETMYAAQVTPLCEVEKPSELIYWTTDVACPKPKDLTVTPYPFSADLTWIGYGESYTIQWAEAPATRDEGIWLQYDEGTQYTSIGNTTDSWRSWGVRYPATMLEGNNTLTKIAFQENSNYWSETTDCIVKIYSGAEISDATLVSIDTITPTGVTGMNEFTLSSPVIINPTESLWITMTVYGTYVMSACTVNNRDNQWWDSNADGVWTNMADDNSNLADYGWMIRGYVEGFDPTEWDWNTATTDTVFYTIPNLQAETTYAVRVQSNCGEDGVSNGWTWVVFTTPSACHVPFDLEATDVTDAATLNWSGYQTSYNLRYRTTMKYETVWEDNFENGIDEDWTIVAGEEATYPSGGIWYAINPQNGLSFDAHSGTYCASSWSWNSSAYNADNWLISPQLDLQGVLKYYVRTNSGYPDSYEVLLSTTDNDTTNFTDVLKEYAMAPANGEWNEVVIDLSNYVGQQGYIAIHHVGYDNNYLCIDDFGIYNVTEAGEWVTLASTTGGPVITSPTTISDLELETEYEWQVQGKNRSCTSSDGESGLTDWSDLATFTTPSSFSIEIDGYDGDNANWYLIASPFDSDPANVSGMTDGDFDLYRFNPLHNGQEWENYKVDTTISLEAGQGYLYANGTDITLTFYGSTTYESTARVHVPLTYDAEDIQKCWNLVGNPFQCEATINTEYYVLDADNMSINPEPVAADTPIPPFTAVFVIATDSIQDVYFSAAEQPDGPIGYDGDGAKGLLRIKGSEGLNLNTMDFNMDNTKVKMSITNKENYNKDTYDKMPVKFKAGKDGEYTLTFTVENMTFSYLHLLDRATKTDVDLLANPEYTFKAKAGEDASRFFIEYKVK